MQNVRRVSVGNGVPILHKLGHDFHSTSHASARYLTYNTRQLHIELLDDVTALEIRSL